MAKVGIVCEGSHDYAFVCPIIDQILTDLGVAENSFAALQPTIDATSKQLDGGGYEAVLQWVGSKSGIGFQKYFEKSLFETSETYDLVVIHIDGDVAELSPAFDRGRYVEFDGTVLGRVRALNRWIHDLAAVPTSFKKSVITAIPTLQMEAWVIASVRPGRLGLEARNRKKAAKRLLMRNYVGSAVDRVKQAGEAARNRIPSMRSDCESFDLFIDGLIAAAA